MLRDLVLVVEDNHDFRVCLRQKLEEGGFHVVTVTNGQDAIRILQSGLQPGLILLDLKMPLMSGEEFLRTKERLKLVADIPILVISGGPFKPQEQQKCFFLPKPIIWDEFEGVVRSHMLGLEFFNDRLDIIIVNDPLHHS